MYYTHNHVWPHTHMCMSILHSTALNMRAQHLGREGGREGGKGEERRGEGGREEGGEGGTGVGREREEGGEGGRG